MNLKIKIIVIAIIMISSTSSCNRTNIESEKKVKQWKGDTLSLPEISQGLYQDSLYKLSINKNSKLKITTLLWGECKSCIADLKKWKNLYQFTQKDKNVEIVFYLFTTDIDFFREHIYSGESHKFPLLIDSGNEYMTKNNLPFDEKIYQTFLLDSNNKVILVGNPIYSEKLMKLYKEEINKRLDNQ